MNTPTQRPKPVYVYQSIAQTIADHKIETMFGLVGDANLFMVDHYLETEPKPTYVPVVYEGSAVLAALAYSQVHPDYDQIGIATITHGPALTNCVTALVEGARGRIPMVLLAGDTDVMNPKNLQNIDQSAIVAPTGAGFEQVRSAETCAQDIARAIYRAKTERRPIVANIPANYMWEKVEHETVVLKDFSAPKSQPNRKEVEQIAQILADAKKPLVLAGRGAIDAGPQLRQLAEMLGAALANTLKAKGLFDRDPKSIGLFGGLMSPKGQEVIQACDTIISFGASLHPFTTGKGSLLEGKTVIQVNAEVEEVAMNYHPDHALITDAKLCCEAIAARLVAQGTKPSGFSQSLGGDLAKYVQTTPKAGSGYVNYSHTLEIFERALPQDRIFTTDGGRFMTDAWCRISAPDPRSFIATANFGSIGLGMQTAIGAAAADRNRPVVLFTGDGGFMMGGLAEFNTAVRMEQNMIVVMCNDSAYGAEHIQFLDKAMDPSLSEFNWPSFADIAISLGGQGVRVDSQESLETALELIDRRDETVPLMIELILDAHDVPRMRT